MTQQNAALVEETASASEEMASQAEELMLKMDKFTVTGIQKTEAEAENEIYLRQSNGAQYGNNGRKKVHKINGINISKKAGTIGVSILPDTLKEEGFEEF